MKKILISMLALFAIATTATAQGNSINGHEYVDLGLPSGLLWATCNVGATKPEEYGDYFAWGETETKKNYSWETYKWCKGDLHTLTKYCINSNYGFEGFTDNLTTLEAEDDAAAVNWKGGWRMPTKEEFEELKSNTTHKITTLNGVNGCLFTAKNGNSIFLPTKSLQSTYEDRYASSSLHTTNTIRIYNLFFNTLEGMQGYQTPYTEEVVLVSSFRYQGKRVRPVIKKSENPSGIEINETNFPDEKFRNFVKGDTIDTDRNGYLSDKEIAAVTVMAVFKGEIKDLTGIGFFTELTYLDCCYNQLTKLDMSKNTKLVKLFCFGNQIKGDAMQALVESLLDPSGPKVKNGAFVPIFTKNPYEGNVITKSQVTIAKNKHWRVYDSDGSNFTEYEGSDDTTGVGASLNDNRQMTNEGWYTIDGVKLKGEPTKKGIYIRNGKKVVK